MQNIHSVIQASLASRRQNLEVKFDADVIAYYGEMSTAYIPWFKQSLEKIAVGRERKSKLVIVLTTSGGEVEAVERMVEMQRHFYSEVFFIVPHIAMSAGTIYCMSGNKIFMDYASSLGPIDPQVQSKEGKWVPALGYLDKFEEILEKNRKNQLTSVEFAIAQNQDMAELRRYEQARDLSVTLLKQWLVKYKFGDWSEHRTSSELNGKPVTLQEKEARANEIASQLGDNKRWHSHGRRIGINTLSNDLRLEIDDFGKDVDLQSKVYQYHNLITDYMTNQNWVTFIDCTNTN